MGVSFLHAGRCRRSLLLYRLSFLGVIEAGAPNDLDLYQVLLGSGAGLGGRKARAPCKTPKLRSSLNVLLLEGCALLPQLAA